MVPTIGLTQYRRNIKIKLLILRLIFISILSLTTFLFIESENGLAYLGIVLLIFSSLITITGIDIDQKKIQVKRCYFFGFIPVKYEVLDLKLFSKWDENDFNYGCVGLIFNLFGVYWKFQWMEIIYKINNSSQSSLKIQLNDKELEMIAKSFQKEVHRS